MNFTIQFSLAISVTYEAVWTNYTIIFISMLLFKKIFFGWEKGFSGYPKSNTIEDPKDAIKKTPSSVLYVRIVSAPMVIMEKKAAKHDLFISSLFI